MLQKVIEEQSALLIANRQEQETRELNCRLRQEQDDAYQLGLQADQVDHHFISELIMFRFYKWWLRP
jgi:hypothetical protein